MDARGFRSGAADARRMLAYAGHGEAAWRLVDVGGESQCNHDEAASSPPGAEAAPLQPRKIIHIDMDAFYASIEQRDNEDLRGEPVAVGGSSARGVVAAASYEARRFGVRSAMPSITAKRKCPDLIFVKPRFEVYKQVSREIRAIFGRYTPLIEPLSLDEAYLDVTENLKGMASATGIAKEIRAAICAETRLTASAGVSYNKFLAKLASDENKPDGLFVITPEMGPDFIEALPVAKFHGVGPATSAKMNRLGIHTGLDLRACDLPFLVKAFGKAGRFYYWIAHGVDERPVRANRIRKSIGTETTFFEDLTTFEAMRDVLVELAGKVWRHCEAVRMRGRTVTLKVKYLDFQIVTRSRTLPAAIACEEDLGESGIKLLAPLMPPAKGIRLLGLTVSNLEDENTDVPYHPQMSLAL
jgi:DNA polymerase-4